MDFDIVRPIVSGIIGATIAGWLAIKWKRRLPHTEISEYQKWVIRGANCGAGIGIAIGLVLYFGGFLDSHDWRGLGLSLGLVALLPILVIIIGNMSGGIKEIQNGFSAYAISQRTPVAVLYPLMGFMLAGGIWTVISILF